MNALFTPSIVQVSSHVVSTSLCKAAPFTRFISLIALLEKHPTKKYLGIGYKWGPKDELFAALLLTPPNGQSDLGPLQELRVTLTPFFRRFSYLYHPDKTKRLEPAVIESYTERFKLCGILQRMLDDEVHIHVDALCLRCNG